MSSNESVNTIPSQEPATQELQNNKSSLWSHFHNMMSSNNEHHNSVQDDRQYLVSDATFHMGCISLKIWYLARTLLSCFCITIAVTVLREEWTQPCDKRLQNYLIAHSTIAMCDLLTCVVVLGLLPFKLGSEASWNTFNRLRMSTIIISVSSIFILAQGLLTTVGFSIFYNSYEACGGSAMYDSSYTIILTDVARFTVVAFPVVIVPCIFLFEHDIPECHGLSKQRMRSTYEKVAYLLLNGQTPPGLGEDVDVQPLPAVLPRCKQCDNFCGTNGNVSASLKCCKTLYHVECLESWYSQNYCCPSCRRKNHWGSILEI